MRIEVIQSSVLIRVAREGHYPLSSAARETLLQKFSLISVNVFYKG